MYFDRAHTAGLHRLGSSSMSSCKREKAFGLGRDILALVAIVCQRLVLRIGLKGCGRLH